jgi:hypothetical protein
MPEAFIGRSEAEEGRPEFKGGALVRALSAPSFETVRPAPRRTARTVGVTTAYFGIDKQGVKIREQRPTSAKPNRIGNSGRLRMLEPR